MNKQLKELILDNSKSLGGGWYILENKYLIHFLALPNNPYVFYKGKKDLIELKVGMKVKLKSKFLNGSVIEGTGYVGTIVKSRAFNHVMVSIYSGIHKYNINFFNIKQLSPIEKGRQEFYPVERGSQ